MSLVSHLADKNNISHSIAATQLDHLCKFQLTGVVVGESNATTLEGTGTTNIQIPISVESLHPDFAYCTGAVTNTQIADYAVSLEKLAPTAYTTNVTEGSNKLLTSGGAYSNLLQRPVDDDAGSIEQTPYAGISFKNYEQLTRTRGGILTATHNQISIPSHGAFTIMKGTRQWQLATNDTWYEILYTQDYQWIYVPPYAEVVVTLSNVWLHASGSVSPQANVEVKYRISGYRDTSTNPIVSSEYTKTVTIGTKSIIPLQLVNNTNETLRLAIDVRRTGLTTERVWIDAGTCWGTCIFGKGFAINASS